MQDPIEKNNAFHWGCIGKNYHIVNYFLSKSPTVVPHHATNANGQRPIDILKALKNEADCSKDRPNANAGQGGCCEKDRKTGPSGTPPRIMRRMEDALKGHKRGFVHDPRLRVAAMSVTPFFAMWAMGEILNLPIDYLVKLGLFAALYIVLSLMGNYVFNERILDILPIGIYFATKLWFYYTWLVYIMPIVSGLHTFLLPYNVHLPVVQLPESLERRSWKDQDH